ncbi:MAG: MarR family transcriptional regulator [Pseudonocardiaceae bacterium]
MRAVDRLGLCPQRARGERARLGREDVDRLTRELRVTPVVADLRSSQVQVLAALARAPLGLRSGRAVARSAGMSATTAIRAVRELIDLGLAEVRHETLAEGTAREAEVIYANVTHPRWPALAPRLAAVRPGRGLRRASRRVPARLAHLFWNAPIREIDLAEHGSYVARRVLLDGDTQALAWAAEALTAADWHEAARGRGLDPRRRALAENLAASVV